MRKAMNKKAKPTRTSRGGKKSQVEPESNTTGSVRTSIVLPKTVDANLEVYVLRNGSSKGEIITRLLVEFLEKEGYQPFKMPKVEISY
jgi:hypothetical protein